MSLSVGTLPISNDTVIWLKVRCALSDSSMRSTISKIVEREVSRSKAKWLNDLEIAATERSLTIEALWTLIVNNEPLPDPTNTSEVISVQIKQRDEGRLYQKNSEDEK